MHRKDAENQQSVVPIHREEILKLWYSIDQPKEQIAAFVAWLINSDFFKAPCSTEFHLCRPGGLAEHSLNVYRLLKEKVDRYYLGCTSENPVTASNIIVLGLGHDLCKVHFYVPGYRNVKNDVTGQWERKSVFKVEDQFPMGHGEKSVSILQDYFQLSEIEKLAIRWHMGPWTGGVVEDYATREAYRAGIKRHPLVTLLSTADIEASQILEAD
jgi:hypothetical protein